MIAERITSGELKARLAALTDAIGAEATPGLAEAIAGCLDDAEPRIRRAALETIALTSDAKTLTYAPSVGARVLALTRDVAPAVRAESAVALATLPGLDAHDAETALVRLVRDDEAEVRQEAAAALGDLRAERGREALAELLGDPSPEVRFEAAFALASLRDARAIDLLVSSLEGARFTDACEALKRLGDARAIDPLRAHAGRFFLGWPERIVAHGAMYALGAKDEARAFLLGRMNAWNRSERELAIATLGALGAGEVRPVLEAIAADPRDKSRASAITALGHLGDPAAIPLLERLRAEAPELADDAADALERLGRPGP